MSWAPKESFAQSAQFSSTGGVQTVAVLTTALAVGDIVLIAATQGGDSTGRASQITDTLGNTYTRLAAADGGTLYFAVHDQSLDVFLSIITNAGTPTITFTPSPGNTISWIGFRGTSFSGGDAASTRRASTGVMFATPGVATDAISSGSIAAQLNDLLWGAAMVTDASSSTEVQGTGFSGATVEPVTSIIDEWKTAGGAEAALFTDTVNGGTKNYFVIGLAITPAAGGGGGGPSTVAQLRGSFPGSTIVRIPA